jgi:hypothetical protein
MALLIRQAVKATVIGAWLAITLIHPARADEALQLAEQKIKAGLLYNFLKYTEWPLGSTDGASSPLVICIYGADPFDGYLQPMTERTVNQRDIKLHPIHEVTEASECNLLIINSHEESRWPQIRNFLANKSILTVSDMEGFAHAGGMIEFGRKNDRISVEINMQAVTASRLRVEDRLLKLATVVRAGPPTAQ